MASRIDSYEFQGTVGSGTAGTVKLAYDLEHDRHVAIKEFSPSLASDPIFLDRFRIDMPAMRRLDGPNCVRVYDFVEEPGRAWLVSEYVEGASLRRILDHSGFLTPEQSLGTLKGALTGLAYGHSLGLVHRDVKPENLLANRDGVTKLGDFGQALFSPGPGAAGGIPAGTPAYMSPEQVTGGVVDYRSDIYSCGAMLFEFLTGKKPYSADTALALMRMHVSEPVPDPRAANSSLPQGLAEMVMRAMSKDPTDRQPTAFQFLADLESAAVAGYGPDWERRSSIKALVAAIIAMGGVPIVADAAASGAGDGGDGGGPILAPAGEEWWRSRNFLIAAGVAGFLLLMLGGYALAGGFGKKTPTPVAIVSPSASPSPTPSPSPDVSPSPIPSPSPSPSPSPVPTPSSSPTPKSLVFTDAVVYYRICPNSPPSNCQALTSQNASTPVPIQCATQHFEFYEQYHYNYPGPAGGPVKILLSWNGVLPPPGGANDGPQNQLEATVGPGSTNLYPASGSTPWPDTATSSSATGTGYVWFDLFTQPSQGTTTSQRLYYTCVFA